MTLSVVPAVVPPLVVSFTNDTPRVLEDSVEADILISRPVQSLVCRLKGGRGSTPIEKYCKHFSYNTHTGFGVCVHVGMCVSVCVCV